MVLAIYGTAGLAKDMFILTQQIELFNAQFWDDIVFINDFDELTTFLNKKVYKFTEFCKEYSTEAVKIVIAVGEPKSRKILYEKIKSNNYKLATLIHPDTYIYDYSTISEGCIISKGTYISMDVTMDQNVIIVPPNTGIGHDVTIGAHSVIGGCCEIGGYTNIGSLCYIGGGANIKDKLNIGDKAIIGMGSVVLKDVEKEVIVLGNPARTIKNNETGKVF